MKQYLHFLFIAAMLFSCGSPENSNDQKTHLEGTWQLISGTLIEKGDTTITDYTGSVRMIKVINGSHFAFLNHDVNKGKDSLAAQFVAGGGKYELKGDQYTEHLEYCSAREWEGNDFVFTISIQNDTLTQSGVEKVEGTDIDRMNIEKYFKVK